MPKYGRKRSFKRTSKKSSKKTFKKRKFSRKRYSKKRVRFTRSQKITNLVQLHWSQNFDSDFDPVFRVVPGCNNFRYFTIRMNSPANVLSGDDSDVIPYNYGVNSAMYTHCYVYGASVTIKMLPKGTQTGLWEPMQVCSWVSRSFDMQDISFNAPLRMEDFARQKNGSKITYITGNSTVVTMRRSARTHKVFQVPLKQCINDPQYCAMLQPYKEPQKDWFMHVLVGPMTDGHELPRYSICADVKMYCRFFGPRQQKAQRQLGPDESVLMAEEHERATIINELEMDKITTVENVVTGGSAFVPCCPPS